MPTNNPRINTTLESPLYKAIEVLAKQERISLSQKARDLLKEAVEMMEDRGLEMIVKERRKKHTGKSIPIAEAKKQLGLD